MILYILYTLSGVDYPFFASVFGAIRSYNVVSCHFDRISIFVFLFILIFYLLFVFKPTFYPFRSKGGSIRL